MLARQFTLHVSPCNTVYITSTMDSINCKFMVMPKIKCRSQLQFDLSFVPRSKIVRDLRITLPYLLLNYYYYWLDFDEPLENPACHSIYLFSKSKHAYQSSLFPGFFHISPFIPAVSCKFPVFLSFVK